MPTITIKIPPQLGRDLESASQREHLTKSELVRRAVAAYVGQRDKNAKFVSALDQAGDLVGCFEGGPSDLGSNPKHMEGFGKV